MSSWTFRTASPISAAACVVIAVLVAAANAADFEQHIDAGRALHEQGKHDEAIKEFEAAVAQRPNDSMAHLWLARALGRKAEKANALEAALMVSRIRNEFERAVALDPSSVEARSDLMDFYLGAPRSFGGGIEKAQAQADAIARLDPAEGARARARIAEKQRE